MIILELGKDRLRSLTHVPCQQKKSLEKMAAEGQTRRQRAFLGPLPDDFLTVESPTTAQAYPQPQQGQPPMQGQVIMRRLLQTALFFSFSLLAGTLTWSPSPIPRKR